MAFEERPRPGDLEKATRPHLFMPSGEYVGYGTDKERCDLCGLVQQGPDTIHDYYGPGHPEFDAKFRANWLVEMRRLLEEKIPDLTDEKFDEFIAECDKIRDQFVEDMKRK